MSESKLELPVEVRPGTFDDIPFLMDTWMKTHRQSTECVYMTDTLFKSKYRPIIADILSRSSVLVAVNPDDDQHIYGYIVVEYTDDLAILHYAYTKLTFRRLGVFRRLFDVALNRDQQTPITFAGWTYKDMYRHFNLVYNPFLR